MGAGPDDEIELPRPELPGVAPWQPAPPAVAPWDDPDWKSKRPAPTPPANVPHGARARRVRRDRRAASPAGSTPAALWVGVGVLALAVALLVPVAIRKPTVRQATSQDRAVDLFQQLLRDPQRAMAALSGAVAEELANSLSPQEPFVRGGSASTDGSLDLDDLAAQAADPAAEAAALRHEGLDAAYRAGWRRPDGATIDLLITHYADVAGATVHTVRVARATGVALPAQASSTLTATNLHPEGGTHVATLLFQQVLWSVQVTVRSDGPAAIDEEAEDLQAQIEDQLEVIPP